MGEFRKAKVSFHIHGRGSLEVEYEVGAETPEQSFRRAFNYFSMQSDVVKLVSAEDFEWAVTSSCEPVDELDRERELGRIEEMENADMERAREDEADQWRMNR